MRAGEWDRVEEGRRFPFETEVLAGQAVGGTGVLVELRSLKPAVSRRCGSVAKGFIGEEGEQLVLLDRTAHAAPELIETKGVLLERCAAAGTVPTLEGIQPGTVEFEEPASMNVVGAVLRHHQYLRPTVTPVLGAIVVRHNLDCFHRRLVGCDHRRSAVAGAVDAYAVHLNVGRILAAAVGADLYAVLRRKDAVTSARSTGVAGRQLIAAAPRAYRAIAEDTRRQAHQVKRVAPEAGQILNIFGIDGATDHGSFRVDCRRDTCVHRHRLRHLTYVQLNVYGLRLLGQHGHAC